MNVTKAKLLKILNAENLTAERKSELLMLLIDNSDLLTQLVYDKHAEQATKAAKPTKPTKAKAKDAKPTKAKATKGTKTDKVRAFIKSQRAGKEFNVADVCAVTKQDKVDVRGVLNRLYRHEEIKSKTVGYYYK